MKIIYLVLLILTAFSCAEKNAEKKAKTIYQEITCRDAGSEISLRPAIYRVQMPEGWQRHDPSPKESLVDTTKALCEFFIPGENSEKIRITIHNFPFDSLLERIPSNTQTDRWQRQFTSLDPSNMSVIPQSFGGFSGLLFEGSGRLNNQETTILGWAMQLAPEHFTTLSVFLNHASSLEETHLLRQIRSDYTIKAIGLTSLVAKHRNSIIQFARSFELIQDIPQL